MALFLTSFVALLVIIDPMGNAAVFTGLSRHYSRRDSAKIAVKATLIATLVLLIFGAFGDKLLSFMGVTYEAFKIAGGLLLFYTAFKMVLGGHEQTDPQAGEDIAIFPLAIPLMAGPGAITAFILLLQEAQTTATSFWWVVGAMVAVELLSCACLIAAVHLKKLLGTSTLSILARIMGILLAALAVQFVLDGVMAV